jgi:transposase
MVKKQRRKRYSDELKKKAVLMSEQEGVTAAQVADELGVSAAQISQWRKQLLTKDDIEDATKKLNALDENRRLREELRTLKMENEILKKAAVFFASQK